MNFSRRAFIGGAAVFGAYTYSRAFAAPEGLFSGTGAALILGVISDIHVAEGRGDFRKFGDAVQFKKTLRWFDEQGVDGVVVAGDMADNGMINQLEKVGEAWFKVFPNGKSLRDGRKVEQLFVYGNHDIEGQNYDHYADRFQDKESYGKFLICRDKAKAWKDVFKEEYAPIWMKTVKGYQFVGAHWDTWDGIRDVERWFKANAAKIDRTKPFFYIQHPHPGGTVYGKDAWCADKGYAARALSAFPNAVAFSGHSHESLTDERSIWQGAFTSIGTSSLRYGGEVDQYEQRQGMLVKVYADRIVLVRRDFLHDQSLGADWVIPLPACTGGAETRPYAFDVRGAKSAAPKFAAGAKVTVTREKDGWLVEIPCANAGETRAFKYEIATGLKDKDGNEITFKAYDSKYNMPRGMAGQVTRYLVKSKEVPRELEKIRVYPLDSFGNRGEGLEAADLVGAGRTFG
jgi:predicted phosphodiesterase